MRNVMVRAWEIAKEAVVKFGGKVKEYFAMALAQAWKEAKLTLTAIASNLHKSLGSISYEVTKAAAWEKHGYKRVYFYINGIKSYIGFNEDLSRITASHVDSEYSYKEIQEVKAFARLYNENEITI